jgi:hypothetical protein
MELGVDIIETLGVVLGLKIINGHFLDTKTTPREAL